MNAKKKLPYEKTVVTEVKVQLADLMTRTVALKSSVAAPIMLTTPFNSGDALITAGNPLSINSAASCIILSSFEDFEVVFPGVEEVALYCRGLYIHNGSLNRRLIVRPPNGIEQLRLQYIWA